MSNNGPYPETKPKRTNDVKEEIAKRGELTKPPSESFVQAQARARREAQAAAAGMTVAEVEYLEAEKAAYLDAATLPKPKVKGTVEVTLLPQRPVVNADAVAARLTEAESELKAAQDEVAAAEAEAAEAAKQRGFVIENARRRLGMIQDEQRAVQKQQIEREVHERARRLQGAEIENQNIRSTEAEGRYDQFVRHATPLVAKLKPFIAELEAFEREHGPALRVYAAMTWKSTPAHWRVQDRTVLVDRAVRPSQELIHTISNILTVSRELVAQAEQVIAGRREPHEFLLGRLEQASKNWLGHFEKQLAILNHEIGIVEKRGEAFAKQGFIPTVRLRERNPARDPRPQATVQTGWDPHGDK